MSGDDQAEQKSQISVTPDVCVEGQTITVQESCDSAYEYIESAVHRLTYWITVTAINFACELKCRVRTFIHSVHVSAVMTGMSILRQSAILRF